MVIINQWYQISRPHFFLPSSHVSAVLSVHGSNGVRAHQGHRQPVVQAELLGKEVCDPVAVEEGLRQAHHDLLGQVGRRLAVHPPEEVLPSRLRKNEGGGGDDDGVRERLNAEEGEGKGLAN